MCSLIDTSGVVEDSSSRPKISTRGEYPVSPTARNRPSLLSDTHVAALIRSLLVHVLPEGDSDDQSIGPCEDSRNELRFLLSLAFGVVGVEGE